MLALFVLIIFFVHITHIATTSDPRINKLEPDDNEKYATVPPEVSGINDFDANGFTRLMIAAKTGQLEPLKNYIAGGADVHMETSDNNTALLLAVTGGFYYTSIELIHAKSDLNHKNNNGMTPLLLAIVGGHSDIVVGLIDGGADPNVANADGSPAVVMAAQSGSLKVVESLVNKGAALDVTSTGGDTALMFASASGHVSVVQFLLKHGADPGVANKRGYTALIFAALRGHSKVIHAIVNQHHPTIHARDKLGRSALDHAIASSRQEAVDALVALGADLPRSGYRVSAEITAQRRAYLEELRISAAKRRPGRDGGL